MNVMSSKTALSEDDEGKPVVDSIGNELGQIIDVKGGDAYVAPDPGITEKIKADLGWGDEEDTDTYRLDRRNIETVTSNEIRLHH